MTTSRIGHVAIASAAFDDAVAWTLLAWITAFSRSNRVDASIMAPIGLLAAFIGLMAGPVRILLRRTSQRYPFINELPSMLVFMFLSSWVTESMGLHALFGAFLAGVVWPRNGELTDATATKLEPVAMTVLIPLFFSYTGIRTNIGLVRGAELWAYELLIIAVAVLGKAGGAFTGAWLAGFGMRDSLQLGMLLNTRGLVGLVVLNVGLDLGILTPTLFSMMVLMTLVTTLMTAPALNHLQRETQRGRA
jgi:Kef-type K+ transport system membrane component KefB